VRYCVSVAVLSVALGIAYSGDLHPAVAQSAPDAAVIEDFNRLSVVIDGRDYALDALIVRRPGTDKLPIALITHGANPGDPRAATTEWLRGWAHDLAHRGWLAVAVMRRGYGKSGGEIADDAGTCKAPDVGRYLDAHGDDLEAALRSIAKRPDADMSHVVAIGDSAGGAAVMDLAARSSIRLSAVVNISGGLGRRLGPFQPDPACAPYDSDLVWNFARFGLTAHMPTLWLYAENDSWFRPGLVGRMRAAFTGSGGKAQLVMLPPFRGDGHTMFFAPGGRQLLLPELDGFLRANGLPTWNEALFAPLLARLSPQDRESVEAYLRMPTEKALALGSNAGAYWQQGERTSEEARTKALAYCMEQTKAECSLAADNFDPVIQRTPEAKADH
jgi:dienelactone hydrolase